MREKFQKCVHCACFELFQNWPYQFLVFDNEGNDRLAVVFGDVLGFVFLTGVEIPPSPGFQFILFMTNFFTVGCVLSWALEHLLDHRVFALIDPNMVDILWFRYLEGEVVRDRVLLRLSACWRAADHLPGWLPLLGFRKSVVRSVELNEELVEVDFMGHNFTNWE